MSKTYLPYEPDQQLLLPVALQEWLPDDHLAYFISDVVDQLDMSEVTARYERERRGGPPYHPRMMVKVLLYGYCTGRSVRGRAATPGCPETIEETADLVTAEGGRGIAVHTDHTIEFKVELLFAPVKAESGRLDILVNDIWGGDELTEWGRPF